MAETNKHRIFGLNVSDDGESAAEIDYAIRLGSSGTIRIYENDGFRGGFGGYATSDVFSVQRIGTEITYLQNNVVFYTSLIASPINDLLVDFSLFSAGATLKNITITSLPVYNNSIYYDRTVNLDNVQVDSQQVVGQLGYDAVLNEAATKIVFRPKTAPGLY